MKILAIDLSTTTGSICILENGTILAESQWTGIRQHSTKLFQELPKMADEAATTLGNIDVYACGLGPGAFSSLRLGLSALNTLALPSSGTVYGISSGEALAHGLSQTSDAATITIVGDARRDRLWAGKFQKNDTGIAMLDDWKLLSIEEMPTLFDASDLVATSDWERIGAQLNEVSPDQTLITKSVIPEATDVARQVESRIKAGIPSEPLTPVYLHPAVFVQAKKNK